MSMNSDSLQSVEENIVAAELESERYRLFIKAMNLLTGRQKEVLYLRLNHGLSNNEIAMFLNLSDQSHPGKRIYFQMYRRTGFCTSQRRQM